MNTRTVGHGLACFALFSSGLLEGAPRTFSRPLSTDRPDATESPYTVEAGRWQCEVEAFRWTRDSEDGVRDETWTAGEFNLKLGLAANADLQLVVDPYVRVRSSSDSGRTTMQGVGDTTVRLKMNLAGNEDAPLAYGVMPFVKLPTARRGLGNRDVEGGVIFPVAFELPQGWNAGLMGEFDLVRNEADTGYKGVIVATATVSREIAPGLGMFFELVNEAGSSRSSSWATSFNTGVTYGITTDLQLDAGINVGPTDAADDFAGFGGLSVRW